MKGKRSFALDLIRITAFFFVFFYHYNMALSSRQIGSPFFLVNAGKNFDFGQWGTILFVILSGFTSVKSYQRSAEGSDKPFGRAMLLYYRKRVLAIVPMYIICYIVCSIFACLPLSMYDASVVYSLLCLDGYLSTFGVHTCYLIGEWFIGVILILYLLFPLIYEAGKRKPGISLAVTLVLNVFAVILFWKMDAPDCRVLCFVFPFAYGAFLALHMKKISHLAGITMIAAAILFIIVPVPVNYRFLFPAFGVVSFLAIYYLGELLSKPGSKAAEGIRLIISKASKYSFSMFLVHHYLMSLIIGNYVGNYLGRKEYVFYFLLILAATAVMGFFITGAADYTKRIFFKKGKSAE